MFSFLCLFYLSFFLSDFYGKNKKLRKPFEITCRRSYWLNAPNNKMAISFCKFLQHIRKTDGTYNWEWRVKCFDTSSIFQKLPPSLSLAVFHQTMRDLSYCPTFFPAWVIILFCTSFFVFLIFFFTLFLVLFFSIRLGLIAPFTKNRSRKRSWQPLRPMSMLKMEF